MILPFLNSRLPLLDRAPFLSLSQASPVLLPCASPLPHPCCPFCATGRHLVAPAVPGPHPCHSPRPHPCCSPLASPLLLSPVPHAAAPLLPSPVPQVGTWRFKQSLQPPSPICATFPGLTPAALPCVSPLLLPWASPLLPLGFTPAFLLGLTPAPATPSLCHRSATHPCLSLGPHLSSYCIFSVPQVGAW